MILNIKKYIKIFIIIIFIILIIVNIISIKSCKTYKENTHRLQTNQTTLINKINTYRLNDSSYIAEVSQLTLTKEEFKKLYNQKYQQCQELGIKLKRLNSYSQTEFTHRYFIKDTIIDSIYINNNIIDTIKCINYNNNYININGCINNNKFIGNIITYDTLIQTISIIPKKFLWFKYGCKDIKQTIKSNNPYSIITNTEYIKIK